MPRFNLESATIDSACYNLKAKGGAKIEGGADVGVVHNGKKQDKVYKETEFTQDMLQYLEYAMNRVENS